MSQKLQLHFQQHPYNGNYYTVFFNQNENANTIQYPQQQPDPFTLSGENNQFESQPEEELNQCGIKPNKLFEQYGLTPDSICQFHLYNQQKKLIFEPEFYSVNMNLEIFNPNSQYPNYSFHQDNSYIVIKTNLIYGNGKHITTRKIWHNNINRKHESFLVRLVYSILERIVDILQLNLHDSIISMNDVIYQKLPNNLLDIKGVIIEISQEQTKKQQFHEDEQYQQQDRTHSKRQRHGRKQQYYDDEDDDLYQQQKQIGYEEKNQILINSGEVEFKPFLYGFRYLMYNWFYTFGSFIIFCLSVYLFGLYYFVKITLKCFNCWKKNRSSKKTKKTQKQHQSDFNKKLDELDKDFIKTREEQQRKRKNEESLKVQKLIEDTSQNLNSPKTQEKDDEEEEKINNSNINNNNQNIELVDDEDIKQTESVQVLEYMEGSDSNGNTQEQENQVNQVNVNRENNQKTTGLMELSDSSKMSSTKVKQD